MGGGRDFGGFGENQVSFGGVPGGFWGEFGGSQVNFRVNLWNSRDLRGILGYAGEFYGSQVDSGVYR